MNAASEMLEANGLVKAYGGKRVVDRVDVRVNRQEIVGLLGPNGAGKTTTFYMVVGLTRPSEGRVFLDGMDITEDPMYQRARKGVSYLAQEPSVFRKLTVSQNLLAILEMLHVPAQERKERLLRGLRELGIDHLAEQKALSLSGRGAAAAGNIKGPGDGTQGSCCWMNPLQGFDPHGHQRYSADYPSVEKSGAGRYHIGPQCA